MRENSDLQIGDKTYTQKNQNYVIKQELSGGISLKLCITLYVLS